MSDKGTGQGQTISPLLANIYLHHVLDAWFEEVVKPRLRGEAHEIRFADDAILCFHYREDAEKVKNDYAKPLSEKAMNRYLLAKVAAWPNQVPQVRDSTSTHASLKERLAAGPSHLP